VNFGLSVNLIQELCDKYDIKISINVHERKDHNSLTFFRKFRTPNGERRTKSKKIILCDEDLKEYDYGLLSTEILTFIMNS